MINLKKVLKKFNKKKVLIIGDAMIDKADWPLNQEGLLLADLPEQVSVETVSICHPETNTALDGLYLSGGMYCTQCEAEGFRKITYYPDRPDVMAVFTVTVEGPHPVLLSNGNPITVWSSKIVCRKIRFK